MIKKNTPRVQECFIMNRTEPNRTEPNRTEPNRTKNMEQITSARQ